MSAQPLAEDVVISAASVRSHTRNGAVYVRRDDLLIWLTESEAETRDVGAKLAMTMIADALRKLRR